MDGARLLRIRWRLHGAWMWPAFIVLALLDGAIVAWRPLSGDHESPVTGCLIGLLAGLVAVAVVAPAGGMLLRRVRRDMPRVVARDYAGTIALCSITLAILGGGLIHHAGVMSDRHALEDAIARAEAYIGDRAPAEFRRNLSSATTYILQPGSIYRTCVRSDRRAKTYCVIVRRHLPFARSVTFAGYEPNAVFSRGAW
jgi:hypothetical protein